MEPPIPLKGVVLFIAFGSMVSVFSGYMFLLIKIVSNNCHLTLLHITVN